MFIRQRGAKGFVPKEVQRIKGQSKESANVMAHGGHERAVSAGLVSTIDADVSECFCRLVIIRLPRLRFPLRRAEVYLQFGLSADFSQFSSWALAA